MHTSYTFYHSLSITATLLLLLIIFKKFRIIKFSRKKALLSLALSLIVLLLSLFYTEERNSGMGILKTYGFPKFFLEYWSDLEQKVTYSSFKFKYFFENLIIYFLTFLALSGFLKNKN